jgi:hypothetical protein
MASLTPAQRMQIVRSLVQTIEQLKHQLEWLKRQVFGSKSERLSVLQNAQQLTLQEMLNGEKKTTPAKVRTVAEHTRRVREDDVEKPRVFRSSMKHACRLRPSSSASHFPNSCTVAPRQPEGPSRNPWRPTRSR